MNCGIWHNNLWEFIQRRKIQDSGFWFPIFVYPYAVFTLASFAGRSDAVKGLRQVSIDGLNGSGEWKGVNPEPWFSMQKFGLYQ